MNLMEGSGSLGRVHLFITNCRIRFSLPHPGGGFWNLTKDENFSWEKCRENGNIMGIEIYFFIFFNMMGNIMGNINFRIFSNDFLQ